MLDYLRAFKMVVVGNRAFSMSAIAMIGCELDGWTLKTNTGQVYKLNTEETQIFKRECQQGLILAPSSDPLAFLRQALNWIVLHNRAINLQAIMAVGETPDFKDHMTVHLFGGWEVILTPIESQMFKRECQNLIFEAQKLATRLQPR